MTQDEIIEMAKQAGFYNHLEMYFDNEMLEAFANLVTKKVEARYMQLFLDPENQPTQFGTATQEYREQEIKNEREACARAAICYDSEPWKHTPAYSHVADMVSVEIGKAIRARGTAYTSSIAHMFGDKR